MMIRPFILVLVAALFVGCAHQRQTRSSYNFRDAEVADWRKSAVEAASSPEQWERGGRITQGPLRLDTDMMEYQLDGPVRDSVIVSIPCWGERERGATCLKITLDRANCFHERGAREMICSCLTSPDKSLELTPASLGGFVQSCHDGCLRSRELNRASDSQIDCISPARMQLNSIRYATAALHNA